MHLELPGHSLHNPTAFQAKGWWGNKAREEAACRGATACGASWTRYLLVLTSFHTPSKPYPSPAHRAFRLKSSDVVRLWALIFNWLTPSYHRHRHHRCRTTISTSAATEFAYWQSFRTPLASHLRHAPDHCCPRDRRPGVPGVEQEVIDSRWPCCGNVDSHCACLPSLEPALCALVRLLLGWHSCYTREYPTLQRPSNSTGS